MFQKVIKTALITFIFTLITLNVYAFSNNTHVQGHIIAKDSTIVPNKPFSLGVLFDIEPGWHIYWDNSGDAGYKTEIKWQFNQDVTVLSENVTPTPHVFNSADITDYGYKNNVLYTTNIQTKETVNFSTLTATAKVSYLVCKDVCLPGEFTLVKNFNVDDSNLPTDNAYHFEEASLRTPVWDNDIIASTTLENGTYTLKINGLLEHYNSIRFIPSYEGFIIDSAPQKWEKQGTNYTLKLQQDNLSKLSFVELHGILNFDDKKFIWVKTPIQVLSEPSSTPKNEDTKANNSPKILDITALPIAGAPAALENNVTPQFQLNDIQTNRQLQIILLFAFLGGLILNLMPCVLPVLSIKALGLLHHAQNRFSWWYGLIYTLGILVSFTLLAFVMITLKQGGHELGWGFQLQSPLFVATLALIMLLVGLQLSGVFSIGASMGRLQNLVSGHGAVSTFLSGMLITAVATPCTAPFMATAIGFSLTQPNDIIYLTFAALGFGLAFPYLLMTFIPPVLRLLPKPGAWEETFQHFLAFPMFATVLWLVSVYTKQTSVDELFILLTGLLAVAFASWIFGRLNVLSASYKKRVLGFIVFIGSILYFYFVVHAFNAWISPKEANIHWQPWSIEKVEEGLSQGRPVFVNFTADWCITCKVNEKITFTRNTAAKFVEKNGVLMLQADWTSRNEVIRQELKKFGRSGVPLYLMYLPNNPKNPQILGQIITLNDLKEALKANQQISNKNQ